jgi:hypothetical protein
MPITFGILQDTEGIDPDIFQAYGPTELDGVPESLWQLFVVDPRLQSSNVGGKCYQALDTAPHCSPTMAEGSISSTLARRRDVQSRLDFVAADVDQTSWKLRWLICIVLHASMFLVTFA